MPDAPFYIVDIVCRKQPAVTAPAAGAGSMPRKSRTIPRFIMNQGIVYSIVLLRKQVSYFAASLMAICAAANKREAKAVAAGLRAMKLKEAARKLKTDRK